MSDNEYLGMVAPGAAANADAASPEKNPYLGMIEDAADRRRQALAGSLAQSVGSNPDVFAGQRRIAKYLGYPVAAVEAMPDLAEQAKVLRVQNDVAKAPTLAQRYTDADFAKLAHDDSGVLATLETSIAQGVRYLMGATPTGGIIGTVKAMPDRAAQGIAGVKAMAADVVEPWARLISGKDNQAAQMSAYYKALARQAEARGDALDPPDDSVVGGGLSGGVNSLLQSSKYLPIALAGGPVGAAVALAGMVGETIGQSYLKADEKGLPLLSRLIYGISDGVVEYATEKGPLGALVHSIKAGTPLGKAILQNAGKEMKGEQIATALQDLNAWAALNPDKPFADYLAERPEAAAKTAIGVLVGAAGNTALTHSMQRSVDMLAGRDRQAEYNVAQATALQEQLQMALNSKLRERGPEEFRAAVQSMADSAAEANPEIARAVFVDAEVLNQLPPEVQQLLPAGVLDQMAQALATGDAVEIPIGDALAIAPGTPLEQTLVEHGRIGDPSMPSQFETKQAGALAQQMLATEAQSVIKQAADAQAMQDSSDRVAQTILTQLQATGRFRQAVNEGYATWAAAFYTTMAGRTGMTPEAMHAKYPLRIVDQTGAGEVMDQGAATRAEPTGAISPITRKPVFDVFDAAGNKVSTTHSADSAEHAVAMANKMLELRANPERAPIPAVSVAETAPEVKKASNWKAVRGETFTGLDDDDGYLYHVTSALAAKGIRANGLAPNAGGNFEGAYSAHSSGRVFLTERSGVSFWKERIEAALQHGSDNPPAVVVLRIPKDKVTADLKADDLGSKDARAPAYFSTQTLNQAASQTETPEFRKWFGDSKVVDAAGKPLVVYHGTAGDFTAFDAARAGTQQKSDWGPGIYLTPDPHNADYYRGEAAKNSDPASNQAWEKLQALEKKAVWVDGSPQYPDGHSEALQEFRRQRARAENESGTVMPVYAAIKNPMVIEYQSTPDAFAARRAKEAGHDGIVVLNGDGSTNEIVVFRPTQIKSATGNSGAFDSANPSILEQAAREQTRDLLVQHNLSAENLLHAQRMGGIPVPSLAVTKKQAPMESFGEITLLGAQEMADPKGYAGTKVFGADIYSPRYPSIEFKLDNKAQRALNDALAPFRKDGDRQLYGDDVRRPDDITSNKPFKRWAADRLGKDEASLSWTDLKDSAGALMRQIGASEQIFQGFTNSGNRKYTPHTLDNVIKILKKELRGGENFHYGVGSLRAKFTPQFHSIAQIQKAKGRLMGKAEFEAVKKEVDAEFVALSNDLDLSLEQTIEVIEDAAKMNAKRAIDRAFKDYKRDASAATDEQAIAVGNFARKLVSLPTEYFEAKILRAVAVAEFAAAVVPVDSSQDVLDALAERGVKRVAKYDPAVPGDRAAKIAEFDDLFFQSQQADTPRGTFDPQSLELALNANANLTTFFHETGHFFLEVMADLSSQPDAPAEIAADMGTVLAWFGVPDLDSWQGMTLAEQRPYHERFAESIEQYVMEGKAPSAELQPLFRKFRAWVLNVYRSAKAFIDSRTGATEIQLSDEVRKVFDRMLASQEEIRQAEEIAGMMPNTEATADAVEKLTARSMRDLAWTVRAVANAVRRLNRQAAIMRREVRIEARAEIMQQPVYQAWRFLTGKGDAVDRANPPPKNETTGLDVTKDSLTVAIAKLGGINRESARTDAGVHPDYHRTESGVFGKPVFRKEGGRSADSMAEALAEAHYLPVDEDGKHSLHDLEDALADELGGSPRYSLWYDRAQSMGDQGGAALPENANVGKLSTEALREMFGTGPDALWRKLSALGMTSDTVGLSPDFVADAFGFENGKALAEALADAEPMRSAIEGLTDQRMLEQHGELVDEASIRAAANQAVHNEARARSLATELKAQSEMANPRTDTGQTNAAGSKITVNAIVEAAKQFAANVVAGTPLKDMKALAWKHTAAERRANTRWQQATMAGDTAAAVKAKQDQVLHNAAAKAAMDAMGEAKDILEFFRRVVKDGNEKTVEKGRDPDVVNAARAILAAYGVGVKGAKSALDYLGLVEKNDPAMFAALQPSLQGALNMAQPLNALTMEQLQGLHEEIQAMWHLARRSRQMEVQGDLIDIDDAADELSSRMAAIGAPLEAAGTSSALTPAETRTRWLQFAGSLLRRTEQWAEGMDGKYGGPFLKLVFGPVKAAADAYRADRVVYRKAYQALVDAVAPTLRKGLIEAPELGYTFGKGHNGIGHAELLHAILHTGNASNKRKLLLGRNWATENADGTLDTQKWDAFIQRMHDTGVLGRAHYDFAQGVWDLLEKTKPLAQKAHRDVFGRYFSEVTADAFDTPFGQYRGGYVPAQADPRIVQDADMRNLAALENESMSFSFPATNKGFTKSRVDYNRPLMLDLRTIGQHIDKVLLFSHMEPAVRDVNKLLSRKPVSQPLGKIDPTIYAGMLTPWLNRSARQVVETPIVGDGGISRVLSAARSRAGMALMFANISNALQQVTGFAGALAKLKADGMKSDLMKSTALFICGPKKMAAAVAAASPFMANRMANEIAAINDAMNEILLDPGLYERAQAWTAKHAYFLQSAMDNTMGPIIWTAAYNAALGKSMSQDDAVRYADGVIRQTQGSTLPEDISRIETGPAYARVFTQFIGYFNMMANTNATAVKQIAMDVGLKRGAGKALGLVTLGMLAPIWVAEAIAQAMRGGPDDPEGDGWLDDWLMAVFGIGTIKGVFAMVPFVGQLANAAMNRFNGNPVDDKMSLSPAVSLLEAAVGVPVDIYKAITGEVKLRTLVRDVASAVSIATGLPAMAIARPLGYLAGVEQGQIEPTSAADAVRGAITGSASPDSKQ